MDKLRAMHYLTRIVETGSFAAAARDLNVSAPAVTQLIAALERSLGTRLIDRGGRRIALTADGELYYDQCAQTLAGLRATEARLSTNQVRASGKLVVGMSRLVSTHCIGPYLPQFLAEHPGLSVEIRMVHFPTDPQAALVDMMLCIGFHDDVDVVAKLLAQTRTVTCAAPAYWRARGVPRDPQDLLQHACMAYHTPRGVVLDVWKYRRGEELRSVAVQPVVVSEDRDALVEAAIRGGGVIKVADLTTPQLLDHGLLEPVLTDWDSLEAPPVYLMYRRGLRASARVRAFADFARRVILEREAMSGPARGTPALAPKPDWFRTKWVGPLTRRSSRAAR